MTRPCASLNWYEPGVSGMEPAGGRATTVSASPQDGEHGLDDLVLLLGGEVGRAREAQHPLRDPERDVAAEDLAVAVRPLDPHRRPDRACLDALRLEGGADRLPGAVVSEHGGAEPAGGAGPRLVGPSRHAAIGQRVAISLGEGATRFDEAVEPLHLDHADRGGDV